MAKPEKYKFIANLGDADPLESGGYFIYSTGVHRETVHDWSPKDVRHRAELLAPLVDGSYLVYIFDLERFKLVEGYLVPIRYDKSWPHPVERYDEWFHKELSKVAASMGQDPRDLEKAFTSKDPIELARAYEDVANYHGWENFDTGPVQLKRSEVKKRYRKELAKLRAE